MVRWFESRTDLERGFAAFADIDNMVTREANLRSTMPGFCDVCNEIVQFAVTLGEPEGQWRNLNEGFVCPGCGLNGRLRNALNVWHEVIRVLKPLDVMVLERVTPFFERLRADCPSLIGCEYLGPEKTGGKEYPLGEFLIRHESLMSLSLSDSSLDLLAHFDVLEHVPDLRLGLAEAYRVLRPGGAMLFTVPFYPDLEENIVCAQLGSDGGIVHFRPPSYHGNPVSSEGALVFTVPGWSLLTDVKAAGFCLKTSLAVDPAGGILSNGCPFPDGRSWALTFLASKPG